MSAEHIAPALDETQQQIVQESHLRVVEPTDGYELSLAEKAHLVRNPDAAYKEARATNIVDTAVEVVTKPLPPYREAQVKMAYFAIDAFVDRIIPKQG